jgi:hypothetical protein
MNHKQLAIIMMNGMIGSWYVSGYIFMTTNVVIIVYTSATLVITSRNIGSNERMQYSRCPAVSMSIQAINGKTSGIWDCHMIAVVDDTKRSNVHQKE